MKDRVGLGWRPELAAGILSRLDAIDVVEVIADDYFDASRIHRRALSTLAAQLPITLHGVGLGMASCSAVERRRLDKMARLVNEVEPECWSEHLAFVRAGGIEIGHLSAPPRTVETVEATLTNLAAARRIVGSAPQIENIATLLDPPGSTLDEPAWLRAIALGSGSDLLLDLHNVHANTLNFGHAPLTFLAGLPLDKVAMIHLAGGKWIGPAGQERLLDDHLHDVPDPVFALLEEVAARVRRPLTVIIERDGEYPPIEHLVQQLARARAALAQGRARAEACR
ncbi:MAG: DUF692 domain-containing protein [Chthoniobacter sp.]|nr:DUF692 domain-containing protein [Chthoniobacter sp.]